MPAWAAAHPHAYWAAPDEHERANGRLGVNIEFALPREFDVDQRIAAAHPKPSLPHTRRMGWQWHRTRRLDPARVDRHWLVLAVATLWVLAHGTRVEEAAPGTGP